MILHMKRQMVITALKNGEFRIETSYQNRLGYWIILSTTITQTFPMLAVSRVSGRDDFRIRVRAQ